MAKKKKEVLDITDSEPDYNLGDIKKAFGDVFLDAAYIIDNPPANISVSPKIDIALGGGVPEGSLFIMTGKEKVGKTITALEFCKNAQQLQLVDDIKRKVYYANIEGRLKKRDILGIHGLNYTPDVFEIIGSKQGNILSGEKYLSIIDNIIHNQPHSVCVIDSFSALAAGKELKEELEDSQVAAMSRYTSKFTRRFANVLPINKVTLVGITHIMANIGATGNAKKTTEKSGNALKYAQDVKLYAGYTTPIMKGTTQIGQEVHWKIENSAIGPPGQKVTSFIKYNRGIWCEYEVAELCKDFGIAKGGGWLTIDGLDNKIQGLSNFATYLEENQNAYENYKKMVFEMVGL